MSPTSTEAFDSDILEAALQTSGLPTAPPRDVKLLIVISECKCSQSDRTIQKNVKLYQ
jgi:hypothetical protein